MKKLVITILAIFYLGVSSGASLHVHHCMGELVEWGFSDNSLDEDGKCTSCGMKQGNSELCCKTQKQEFKLKDSYKAPFNVLHIQYFALLPQTYLDHKIIAKTPALVDDFAQISVPPSDKTPAFIRNCNFRI
jgi:hypothetical protein